MVDIYKKILYGKQKNEKLDQYLKNKSVILVGPSPYLENRKMGDTIDSYDVVVRVKTGFPVPEALQSNIGTRTDLWYTNFNPFQNKIDNNMIGKLVNNQVTAVVFPYPIQYERLDVFQFSVFKLINIMKTNYNNGVKDINQYFQTRNQKPSFWICYDSSSLYFQYLEKIMGTRPTTGVCVMMDLLQYDIKELQIIGFTFRFEVLKLQKLQPKTDIFKKDSSKIPSMYSKYYKTKKETVNSWNKTLSNNTHDIYRELRFINNLRQLDNRFKIDDMLQNILKLIFSNQNNS